MKNQFFKLALLSVLLPIVSCENQQDEQPLEDSISLNTKAKLKGCATHTTLNKMFDDYPEIKAEADRLEKFSQKVISEKSLRSSKEQEDEIIIPVIVHVVYNTDEQNIKWRQVRSQIDALNRDFNMENEDISKVPGFYKKRVADVGIRFELKRITRTKTDVEEFVDDASTTRDDKFDIASTKLGGKNSSDTSKYLNIWVGKFGGGFGGLALTPSARIEFPKLDGVFVDYRIFGTTDIAQEYGSLGRTAVHEVGHWLNLLHLGGLGGNCKTDDGVSDTPKQSPDQYIGNPGYPETVSCNTPDMVMNYMQSLFDDLMFMFTQGQKDRMRATFEPGGPRASFK